MLIPLETVSNNFDYIGMNASVAKKIDEILKLEDIPDSKTKVMFAEHSVVFDNKGSS